MMNALSNPAPGGRTAALAALMAAAGVALTLGFACALPLAAFAAMAALLFSPVAAVGAILAVWLANQIVGFACLGYPTDAGTLAWGAGLGVIGLLSLAASSAVLARGRGAVATGLAFVAAFIVYEGAVYAGCLATRTDLSDFTPATVGRIFLVNAAAFGAFLALRALTARSGREDAKAQALRHA
jgi:hypothetical protein